MRLKYFFLLLTAPLLAQTQYGDGPVFPTVTVATLPNVALSSGKSFYVSDSNNACTSGGGASLVLCRSNGTSWVAVGGPNGNSIFNSYQFGSQTAITGQSHYLQTTYPAIFSLAQTGAGTSLNPYIDAISMASQAQNTFLAAPNGSSGAPSFRAIVAADIPTLNQNTSGNAGTATALASVPTQCTGVQFATGIAASGNANCATPPQGTVTSVTTTFTGGLISVSGSPITGSGTFGLTVAGTSGGLPYFSSASTWASSAVLSSGAFVLGGGAGAGPVTSFSVVPVNKGGTGTGSTLVGIVRGDPSIMTAAELSGDATTSGSNVVSVVNGSHITNASIANSGLVNASVTVSGTTCTLGSSCSPPAGGSVFTGSTCSTVASSATPAFSLADVSSQSPICFDITPIVNVTAPTITNKSAGAHFYVVIHTDGTHTWSWNSIASGACQVDTDIATTVTAGFLVEPDGTTVIGDGTCAIQSTGLAVWGATTSAPSVNPSSGNILANLTSDGLNFLDSSGNHHRTVQDTTCSNQFVRAIAGAVTCATIADADVSSVTTMSSLSSANGTSIPASATLTQTICSGTVTVNPGAISSGAKSSTITATCTGLLTTDNIQLDFNSDPTATTGYVPSSSGILTIFKFPTANTINVVVENNTAGSVTPGSLTLNYRVVR